MKKRLLLFSFLLIFINGCTKSDDAPTEGVDETPVNSPYAPDNSFKIIAYMPSYRDPATIDISKYKMITHLLYAFLQPNKIADGSLMALPQPLRFENAQQRAKLNNVKFGISIGLSSAGFTEEIFANIAKSPTARANFVANVTAFAKNNNLDGVDIDWEYPITTNGMPSADYTALMKELSAELHKINKFLSTAVTAAVYASTNKDAIAPEVYQYVDFFNIMQYDGAGYDKDEMLNHASYKMSVASLDVWLGNKGMPKEKAIVGIPLYGRNGTNTLSYREIEASGADVNLNVATVNGTEYGFNGILLVKQKTQLAKQRANGIMFWEFWHDANNSKSLIRAANDQLGRAY